MCWLYRKEKWIFPCELCHNGVLRFPDLITKTFSSPVCYLSLSKSYYIFLLSFDCVEWNFKDFIYLFLQRGEGREKERESNINVWLPLMCPLLGTWPATQACALTGNRTSYPLVLRRALNPPSLTSQEWIGILKHHIKCGQMAA